MTRRERKEQRQIRAVACAQCDVTFGPVRVGNVPSEGIQRVQQVTNGLQSAGLFLQDVYVPVAWVMTENKDALLYVGA